MGIQDWNPFHTGKQYTKKQKDVKKYIIENCNKIKFNKPEPNYDGINFEYYND